MKKKIVTRFKKKKKSKFYKAQNSNCDKTEKLKFWQKKKKKNLKKNCDKTPKVKL